MYLRGQRRVAKFVKTYQLEDVASLVHFIQYLLKNTFARYIEIGRVPEFDQVCFGVLVIVPKKSDGFDPLRFHDEVKLNAVIPGAGNHAVYFSGVGNLSTVEKGLVQIVHIRASQEYHGGYQDTQVTPSHHTAA
jgi:hypothetical protein